MKANVKQRQIGNAWGYYGRIGTPGRISYSLNKAATQVLAAKGIIFTGSPDVGPFQTEPEALHAVTDINNFCQYLETRSEREEPALGYLGWKKLCQKKQKEKAADKNFEV